MEQIFTDEALVQLAQAENFNDLASRTKQHLADHNVKQTALVSGPITTGGLQHQLSNMLVMDAACRYLQEKTDMPVFPSLYLLPVFDKLKEKLHVKGYAYELINNFFGELMHQGLITKLYMLPDWKSSTGAKIEYELAKQAALPRDEEMLANYAFLPAFLRYQIQKHSD